MEIQDDFIDYMDEEIALRLLKMEMLQEHYALFNTFLNDVMALLGFGTTWMQHSIATFLQTGPEYLMVQSQRGQAKTTITAAYAVWYLIQNPKSRVLVVSAAGPQASDISTLIVRIIMHMDQLECMRPEKSKGDRTSTENFDLHYSIKGVDKSASVACLGITGTLVGKRADLLIADDVESPKNSATATQREQLMQLTREFTSINADGRIVYLGTPQSIESVYNTLPSRGFTVRIWPGRYPTAKQLPNYGEYLAPEILQRMEDNPSLMFGGGLLGDQGQPTDPAIQDEAGLQKKEMDQGQAHFLLQFMLDTSLADSQRFPLKPENLLVMRMGLGGNFPMSITRAYTTNALKPFAVHSHRFHMSVPHGVSEDVAPLQGICMYVDPAGGGKNGDENGYAVAGFLNGNVYLLDVGGFPGGYSVPGLELLAEVAARWQVNTVIVEKNMGFGAFREVWTPILRKVWKGEILDDLVTGQKERRIISTLEPIMGRGALIVNEDIVERDTETTSRYDASKRITYSFFHQLAKITHDAGCLSHDDRLDAVCGAVAHWLKYLAIDEDVAAAAKKKAILAEFMKDPLGHNRYISGAPSKASSILNRFRR